MTTVLLVAFLAVWLLLAAVLGHLVATRQRLVKRAGLFRCKVRVESGKVPHLSSRWPRRVAVAEWRHDVLVLHCGFWLISANPLAVRFAEDVIEPVPPASKVRLGPGPVMLALRLDDDSVITVSTPAQAREKLAGPFLAIAVQGLPPATSERGR